MVAVHDGKYASGLVAVHDGKYASGLVAVHDGKYASGLVAARSRLLQGALRARCARASGLVGCAWRIGVPDVQYAS